MTAEPHVVDADAVEEPGTELATVEHHQAPTTLFRTDDPVEVVARASKVADALKGVLDQQGLTANISGKRHVLVEGWTTLGAMVGVTAVPVWTKPLDGDAPQGRKFGFEARVEARTLDGRVIGAAEAMCTRDERRWRSADDYAIRSMAQTRATSKALRGPLGFVVTLAGYQATPAEEMPTETTAATSTATVAPQLPDDVVGRLFAAAREGIDAGTVDGQRLKLRLVDLGATTTSGLREAIASLPPDAEAVLAAELAAPSGDPA